jgi:CheY-like chemotaxis protein
VNATAVPSGAGRRLTARGRLAVGPAALGHPLQLGISETLAGCTRAAIALAEHAADAASLERRYAREGLEELLLEANEGAHAALWLARAGDRAARAIARAARRSPAAASPFTSGVLGLGAPSPKRLLSSARRAGLAAAAGRALRWLLEPVPPVRLVAEPDLYYVVDDDDQAREALTQLLESQGARVVAFSSELALYSAVARRPPTAVLLDVVLHWVDGLRLCQGLKQHPLTRRTRVFVMSGLDVPHVRAGALDAGAEAFLPKPVEPRRVLQLLADDRALWLSGGGEDGDARAPASPAEAGSARDEVG